MNQVELKYIQKAKSQTLNMDHKKSEFAEKTLFVTIYIAF